MFLVNSLSQLPDTARQILTHAGSNKIFVFYGDMGAGKTTLIKELCATLGVQEAVTSPTFSIVNEYIITGGKIYHFDFYRLKTESEALDMGYEEYFYSDNYCFIEWPEKIPNLLPENFTRISIQVTGADSREITVENIS
ncbi:tRNA (adenosine(37)-N6)-threonylcarbamoyltransferase complex ATPase subunit type 1 TsaE [Mucilaginibacter limnophilus]|uniref:tRNA threonylcarbamoyladenosine biosynthesis protein TsaE n=1 Tax=Mucilaginibacter limnophilus TaxID=1932778 RepID=A0A3S2WZ26_9SPHI|nr:tRNA (adenosine(37)-N6)-threonylcarbamoyltransferase complex ATPase subunit type 1 TsaE [Mucilaginibacter limnophilus]RVU01499.1 tRNA (adenosine(37)-N6)-threonylcarbamoyltransferase complex ATPase subunit type 1 TsaE [Mucilaginibacter limnophilus]